MDNLISERVWQDDGFFEIKVTAQSNHAQAATCSYTTNDSIKDLSDRLSVFPLSSTDEYLWQNGTRGDGHTPCVELRFFCKDKLGHIRIEAHLEIDDGGSLDNHHCSFYLSTEPQILNSFGKSLLALNNPITGTKVELNEQLSRSTMSEPNSCYTYFKITGDFDPDDITHLLALSPEKQWRVGDLRRNGTVYDFAM